MTGSSSDEYLSFDEVRRRLALDEADLKRLVSSGEIRVFRDGDEVRFRAAEVDRLEARGVQASAMSSASVLDAARDVGGGAAGAYGVGGGARLRMLSAERMPGGGAASSGPPLLMLALGAGLMGALVTCGLLFVFGAFASESSSVARGAELGNATSELERRIDAKLDRGALGALEQSLGERIGEAVEARLAARVRTEVDARIQAVGDEAGDLSDQLGPQVQQALAQAQAAWTQDVLAKTGRNMRRAMGDLDQRAARDRAELERRLREAIEASGQVAIPGERLAEAVSRAVEAKLEGMVRDAVRREVAVLMESDLGARITEARADFGVELKAGAAERARMRFELTRLREALAGGASATPGSASLEARIAQIEARLRTLTPGGPETAPSEVEPMGMGAAADAPAPAAPEVAPVEDPCPPPVRRRRCVPWPFRR